MNAMFMSLRSYGVFMGGYLVLYAIPWPANGTLKDFVDKLKDYLEKKYYRKMFI